MLPEKVSVPRLTGFSHFLRGTTQGFPMSSTSCLARHSVAALVVAFLACLPGLAAAATITVNSTSDAAVNNDGLCTLREAITAANLNTASGAVAGECVKGDAFPTVDRIEFNIPGSGV